MRLFVGLMVSLMVGLWGCVGVEQTMILSPTITAVAPANEPTNQPTNESTDLPATSTQPPATNPANADVTYVRAVQTGDGILTFHVTIEHPDTGWDDYADGWDVVLPDGSVVLPNPDDPFTRLLLHPHETGQPFTRSQSNIAIPLDVTQVTVRAHDMVDGFGGQEVVVDLTAVSGPNFEVEK